MLNISYIKPKNTLLVFLFAFCTSCGDHKVDECYIIENCTNSSVKVHMFMRPSANTIKSKYKETTVKPYSSNEFYRGSGSTSYPINKNDNYLEDFDTIYLSINNKKKIHKSMYNPKDWDYKKDWSILTGFKTYFRLKIEEKDLGN